MNLIKLFCKKSKFTGDLCDFRAGDQYVGLYINDTLLVDGNHGDLHLFTERGQTYFNEAPVSGTCYCGSVVTDEMDDTAYSRDDSGNLILIHVDCGYERSLERQFGI